MGLIVSLRRLTKGQRRPGDIGALFLGTIFVTALLVLTFLINPHWQRTRYLLMQVQGLFLLLGAHGLREVARGLNHQLSQRFQVDSQASLWQVGGAAILALALSVGVVIDDAIVVLENIFRHQEEGEDPMTAAHRGSKEIALAAMAATFAIAAAFLLDVTVTPALLVLTHRREAAEHEPEEPGDPGSSMEPGESAAA